MRRRWRAGKNPMNWEARSSRTFWTTGCAVPPDFDGDSRVTLGESYDFAYSQTFFDPASGSGVIQPTCGVFCDAGDAAGDPHTHWEAASALSCSTWARCALRRVLRWDPNRFMGEVWSGAESRSGDPRCHPDDTSFNECDPSVPRRLPLARVSNGHWSRPTFIPCIGLTGRKRRATHVASERAFSWIWSWRRNAYDFGQQLAVRYARSLISDIAISLAQTVGSDRSRRLLKISNSCGLWEVRASNNC